MADTFFDPDPQDELIEDDQSSAEQPEEKETPEAPEEADSSDKAQFSARELREMRKEMRELRQRNVELENSAKFWSDKASASTTAPRSEPEPEEEEEDEAQIDLVAAISSNDPRQARQALRKLGFVSEKEVSQRISQTRQQLADEQRLFGDFPELRDRESPFFQVTARHYNALIADDPTLKNDGRAIRIAAKMARAETEASRRETSGDRNRRVEAQSRERGTPRRGEGDGKNDLSPVQKAIVANLRAAGANITEDDYKKRAQVGVRLSGRSR